MLFSASDIKPFKMQSIIRSGFEKASKIIFDKFSIGSKNMFTELNEVDSVEFVSKGQYSAHHILEQAINYVGGYADVIITSYAVTNEPARNLFRLVHNKNIEHLIMLIDKRIQKQGMGVHLFLSSFVDELYLTKIHAKVTLVNGPKGCLTIVQSGNYTKNARIEITRISKDKSSYSFHKKWILNETNLCLNHSNKHAKNSK